LRFPRQRRCATQRQNNPTRFTNAVYEKKPAEWKLCYRAGEPAVASAREFADAWLKELS